MKLPLTPSDTHVVKLLALSEKGLDVDDLKAVGAFVAQLCRIELERRLAVLHNGSIAGGTSGEGTT